MLHTIKTESPYNTFHVQRSNALFAFYVPQTDKFISGSGNQTHSIESHIQTGNLLTGIREQKERMSQVVGFSSLKIERLLNFSCDSCLRPK